MPRPAALVETHSAVVVFVGDHAYKLKKPVDLGFLDFSTRERRQAACHREVALNRRLAPDVYEGVADVTGPDGAPMDHLVVMRRMPDERRLARLAAEGRDLDDEIWRLAHLLAAFHGRSPSSPEADDLATVAATRARWNANSDALMTQAAGLVDETVVAIVHGLACRYLDGRAPLFEARIAAGRSVDGHGDLLADDIFCLADGPRVLDCLDFDDRLRVGDALADVAFLAMDLERLGRPELARRLLDAYAEHSGDTWPPSLAHHHVAYRAQVRAKVAAIRAGQEAPEAAAEARALLDLALRHLEAGRVRLILVGGPPGTGKTTVASALAEDLDAVVLRADVVRKELAGVSEEVRLSSGFGEGHYTRAATVAVYDVLLERAAVALAMGETVILDASWAEDDLRRRARHLAERSFADLVELCCWAPAEVCDTRIQQRAEAGRDASDASPSIAAAMRAAFCPWPEARELDTSPHLEETVRAALDAVHLASAPLVRA